MTTDIEDAPDWVKAEETPSDDEHVRRMMDKLHKLREMNSLNGCVAQQTVFDPNHWTTRSDITQTSETYVIEGVSVDSVIDAIEPKFWDVTAWKDRGKGDYVSGRLDPADARRIVERAIQVYQLQLDAERFIQKNGAGEVVLDVVRR